MFYSCKTLFSTAFCLFLLLFDLFEIYCLPRKAEKSERNNSRAQKVNLRKKYLLFNKTFSVHSLAKLLDVFIRKTWTMSSRDNGKFFHTFVVNFDKGRIKIWRHFEYKQHSYQLQTFNSNFPPTSLSFYWSVNAMSVLHRVHFRHTQQVTHNCSLMHFNLWQPRNIDDGSFMIYNFVRIAEAFWTIAEEESPESLKRVHWQSPFWFFVFLPFITRWHWLIGGRGDGSFTTDFSTLAPTLCAKKGD